MVSVGSISSTRREVTNLSSGDIEEQIKRDGKAAKGEVKILLLGAGKSNTSRFLKSIQLIHSAGYNDNEREGFKKDIFSSTIQALQTFLKLNHLDLKLTPSNEIHQTTILALLPDKLEDIEDDVLSSEVIDAMHNLGHDPGILKALEDPQSTNLLGESYIHYLKSIDRITKEDYLPTDEDILNHYNKPSAITEVNFKVQELTYRIVHIGRQAGAWRKWIHCFEGVKAIVFLVNLAEYNQSTVTDGERSVNCMHEALDAFDLICNSKWFKKTAIILFLDDKDLSKKLSEHPLQNFFPDFTGGADYDAARDYMLKRFVSLDKQNLATRKIYPNLTSSKDTQPVAFMLSAMQEILSQHPTVQN